MTAFHFAMLDLSCDGATCDQGQTGLVAAARFRGATLADCRRAARAHGWKLGKKTFCPRCR